MQLMEVVTVNAKVGDKIVIGSHQVGQPERDCLVLELRHPDGEPRTSSGGETQEKRICSFPVPTPRW